MDDTGKNFPESLATLKAQQEQLLRGDRRVQMFPLGTEPLALKDGIAEIKTKRGVFHYRPDLISESEVLKASNERRENELLDLGPFSKEDLAKMAPNGPFLVIVERTKEGTEVRAAVGIPATIDKQVRAMLATCSMNHSLEVKTLAEILQGRRG